MSDHNTDENPPQKVKKKQWAILIWSPSPALKVMVNKGMM